ncbi:tetratricopeptide repeat protein [Actinosynnema sp. CS-041913]|uniref:tetratricopeptide repeat protein n=1 Tax=Actinosynnema sp. CS-041913 TaxID=3239917 RepID=UPI003D8A5103
MEETTSTSSATHADHGSFAEALRRQRGRESQGSVARRMGYSPSHYSNVENGHKPPTEGFARACDVAFGTDGVFVALFLSSVGTSSRVTVKPAQLPPSPHLVGRVAVLQELDRLLDGKRDNPSADVVALDGEAGVGKTTLAVAWAHRIKSRFPDGTLFVDLHGYAANGDPVGPGEVLEDMLKALGVPAQDIPTTLDWRAALLRTVLNGTRMLLVFDNAARIEQVRSLIPASPGCLVIVTSRRRLSGLAVQYGARCLTVDRFGQDDAVALLRDVVGCERVDAEREAAEWIARFCGGLPLAVRVAAERVAASRHLTLAGLAEDLSTADHRLDALSPYDADEAVRGVLSWSFRALEPAAARLFRLLSLHPGHEFGVDAASALAGCERSVTCRLLDMLAGVHLLHEAGRRRYRFHDLVLDYAVELATTEESPADIESASRRLLYWYLRTAATANLVMSPNRPQVAVEGLVMLSMPQPMSFSTVDEAVAWCETELANLAAATQHAALHGIHDVALGLPMVLSDYLYWRHPWRVWIGPLERCLDEARRCGDRAAQGWILNNLGNAHLAQHRLVEAGNCFGEAMALRTEDGDRAGQVWSLLGVGRVLQAQGGYEPAADKYDHARTLCSELGDEWSWAIVTAYLADAHRALGDHRYALDLLAQAITVFRARGDRQAESCALDKVSDVYRDQGDEVASLDHLNRALAASSAVADRWSRAELPRKLGHRHRDLGDCERAHRAWTEALLLFEALGDVRAAAIRTELDTLEWKAVPVPRRAG